MVTNYIPTPLLDVKSKEELVNEIERLKLAAKDELICELLNIWQEGQIDCDAEYFEDSSILEGLQKLYPPFRSWRKSKLISIEIKQAITEATEILKYAKREIEYVLIPDNCDAQWIEEEILDKIERSGKRAIVWDGKCEFMRDESFASQIVYLKDRATVMSLKQ